MCYMLYAQAHTSWEGRVLSIFYLGMDNMSEQNSHSIDRFD